MSYDELTAKLLREKEQQAARIEKLELEVASLRSELSGAAEKYDEHLDRIEALEKALRPFASVTVLPNGAAVGMERHWFSDARTTLEDKP